MICTDYKYPEIRHDITIVSVVTNSSHAGYDDVVDEMNWRVISYHEDYPDLRKTVDGTMTIPFEPDESTEFIAFSEITEDMLIEWIHNGRTHISIMATQNSDDIMDELFPSKSRKTYTYRGN